MAAGRERNQSIVFSVVTICLSLVGNKVKNKTTNKRHKLKMEASPGGEDLARVRGGYVARMN